MLLHLNSQKVCLYILFLLVKLLFLPLLVPAFRELYQYKEKARDLQNILKMKETKLASAVKKITELEEKKSILDRSLK